MYRLNNDVYEVLCHVCLCECVVYLLYKIIFGFNVWRTRCWTTTKGKSHSSSASNAQRIGGQ